MSENLNFNDALNTLEVFKELCVAKAWSPTLGKNILIKELSAKQQKQLLSSAVESASEYKSYFIKNLYEILLQNCNEPKESINSLNFIDYTSIVISLRKQTSKDVLISFSKEDNKKVEEVIDLDGVLDKLSALVIPIPENIAVKKDNIEINISLKIPTITDDVTFFEFLPAVKKQDTQAETLKQLIAETYMYESAKCIDRVEVAGKDLGYNTLSVKQKYALVEKLPASLIQKLLSQYASWKESVNKALTVKSSSGIEKQLDIDSILFLTS